MTSPPFRYNCKYCNFDNWLNPQMEDFEFKCEKCGNRNLVKYFWFTSFSRVKKIKNSSKGEATK